MKITLIILAIIIVLIVIWAIGTLLVVRWLEEPAYTVIEKRDGYEIRDYQSYIVAEVDVEWDMQTAMNAGFRQLAWYIFGGNTMKTSVKMTVPVMDTNKWSSESIKMTVPVLDTSSDTGKRIVAFTMPSKYTLDTLPKPDNTNIRFRVVEQSRRAVLTYTLYTTEERVTEKKNLLLSLLTRDGIQVQWEITSAQYNPPLSFPFLRRNEVMIEIQ